MAGEVKVQRSRSGFDFFYAVVWLFNVFAAADLLLVSVLVVGENVAAGRPLRSP